MDQSLLLLNESERRFIDQMIETWTAVYESDREGYERFQFERSDVKRKMAGKYTVAETQEIARLALEMID